MEDIAIVIVTHNSWNHLPKCLDSLTKDKTNKKEETTKIKKPRAKKEPKPTPTNKGE